MIRPVRAEVRTIYFYFCPYRAKQYCLRDTQGDALGYKYHWAFSPSTLNPKLKLKYSIEGSDAGMHYTEKEVYHSAYPRLPITNPYKYILNHDDQHQTTESGMDFHA